MKHLKYLYIALFAALMTVVAAGCSDGDDDSAEKRTVLVYMVADNNLSGWAAQDLSEMKAAVAKGLPQGQRWVVYYSGPDHKPRLIEFDREGNERILASYDNSTLSVSESRMREVVGDVKRLAPAPRYGLVLWSHGTGWLNDPGSIDESSPATSGSAGRPDLIEPLSFGYDGGYGAKMKVTSLARALSGHHFDFIYFDCCHMATVEVLYELRHAADRIVGSPTELGVEGMPYDINVALLLNNNVRQAAAATFDFYNRQYYTNGGYGCSIGVYSMAAIEDVALAMRHITDASLSAPEDYSRVRYYRPSVIRSGIYDLTDYVEALSASPSLTSELSEASGRLIEYFATTPDVYLLDASRFSGLAGNIVESPADISTYGYDQLSWYDLVWKKQ